MKTRAQGLGVLVGITLAVASSGNTGWAKDNARAAVERSMRQLDDRDPARRVAAIEALSNLYPEGACGVPLMEVALRDEATAVRTAAEHALGVLGAAGIRDLVAFLADTTNDQNRAFDRARRYIATNGIRATPRELARIEGRNARVARFCLSPLYQDTWAERRVRTLFRDLLADDAGTFDRVGEDLLPLSSRRLACACLAVNGLRSLPPKATPPVSKKLMALTSHADNSAKWGALQILSILRSHDPKAKAALEADRPAPGPPDLKALIARLPDPEGSISPFDLLTLNDDLRDVYALGERAKAVLPRLRALLRKVRQQTPDWFVGLEYYVIAALCRIEGPRATHVQALIEGLEMAIDGDLNLNSKAHHAVGALATCARFVEGKEDRARIARAVVTLIPTAEDRYQPLLVGILGQLGAEARPAVDSLVTSLLAIQARISANVAKAREASEDGGDRTGHLQAFLMDVDGFVLALETRAGIAGLLPRLRPLPAAARSSIRKLVASADPLLRCELAQALR